MFKLGFQVCCFVSIEKFELSVYSTSVIKLLSIYGISVKYFMIAICW